MQGTWSTSAGLDVHLDLSGTRPRARLESALRDAVRSGRLAAGTALPSSRNLARDLGVARNTVAQAYAQLVAEGWLSARHGSGTWVAQRAGELAPPRSQALSGAVARGPRYDLRPGAPDLTAFPRAAWQAAARKALAAAPAADLGYADPRGLEVLRVALAEYLGRARGVRATPDHIVVCSGFTQGLELVCEVLHANGTRSLAVETYSHPGHRSIAGRAGLRLTPLAVDDQGAAVTALRSPAGAVLLTPAHQYPLGAALAPERRRHVADWAVQTGAVVIEDDYDGEFRFDRQAVGALQPLAPEHVVYAGTASKSLAPGLRLGWFAFPSGLLEPIVAAKKAAGRLSSSLDQLALAELIRSGGYDRQIRRARLAYRRRRDHLLSALAREVPEVGVTGIAAGLHAVIRLPTGVAEEDVIATAASRGLAVQGLAADRAGDQDIGP
ncbi:MAG: PLP-dependent aminotransferase family protein, partial [Actinobacteria bacterium]|nr:PLP-dependent aminotransferase family protein [Actinomycetota bacterium]